jgi:hypothetical protein
MSTKPRKHSNEGHVTLRLFYLESETMLNKWKKNEQGTSYGRSIVYLSLSVQHTQADRIYVLIFRVYLFTLHVLTDTGITEFKLW